MQEMSQRAIRVAGAGSKLRRLADTGRVGEGSVSQQGLLRVWEKALPNLIRLAAGMGCGPGVGEDVLQDVYLSALRSGAGKLPAEHLGRWLYRVTVNRCRQEHRRRGRFRQVMQGIFRRQKPAAAPSAAETAANRQAARAVRTALAALEVKLKAPLVMRYFCEMDSKEIGEILGLPDSTVRSRLRAGRMKLAEALRKAGHGRE